MTIEVTKSEWLDWKQSKVTKALIERVDDHREKLKELLATGGITGSSSLDQYIGECMGLKDALDYALHDFEIVDDNKEEEIQE